MDVTHNRNDDPRTILPYPRSENESGLNLIHIYRSATGTMKLLLELGLNPLNRNSTCNYRSNLDLWMIFFSRETQKYLELWNFWS